MNDKPKLDTHDERQSAYRGDGGDASVDGRGRQDPSAANTADAAPPQEGQPQAYYPRGTAMAVGSAKASRTAMPSATARPSPTLARAARMASKTISRPSNAPAQIAKATTPDLDPFGTTSLPTRHRCHRFH